MLLPEVLGQSKNRHHIDINDDGVIACQVVLDPPWNSVVYAPPLYQPQLLPSSISGFFIRINNLGTIIDETGLVIFPPYAQVDLLDSYDSTHIFYNLNNSDVACGVTRATKRVQSVAVRLDLNSGLQLAIPQPKNTIPSQKAWDINDQNDLLIRTLNESYRSGIYTDDTGLLALDDLVASQNTAWLAAWLQTESVVSMALTNSNAITDSASTGFGAICGYTFEGVSPYIGGTRAFVLVPRAP